MPHGDRPTGHIADTGAEPDLTEFFGEPLGVCMRLRVERWPGRRGTETAQRHHTFRCRIEMIVDISDHRIDMRFGAS